MNLQNVGLYAIQKKQTAKMLSIQKALLLSCCLFFINILSHAGQLRSPKPLPLDAAWDKIEYEGHPILQISITSGYYGYDVFAGKQIIWPQIVSPLKNQLLANRVIAFPVANK